MVRHLRRSLRRDILNRAKPSSDAAIGCTRRPGHSCVAVRWVLSAHPSLLPWGEGDLCSARRMIQTAGFPLRDACVCVYRCGLQCARSAAFRPLQRPHRPAAQKFPRFLGLAPRGSGVNAALLWLPQLHAKQELRERVRARGNLRGLLFGVSGDPRKCRTFRVLPRRGSFS